MGSFLLPPLMSFLLMAEKIYSQMPDLVKFHRDSRLKWFYFGGISWLHTSNRSASKGHSNYSI